MKKWWKSKTVWFNTLAGVVSVLAQSSAELSPIFGPTAIGVIAAVNILLRTVTNQPLGKPEQPKESENQDIQ